MKRGFEAALQGDYGFLSRDYDSQKGSACRGARANRMRSSKI